MTTCAEAAAALNTEDSNALEALENEGVDLKDAINKLIKQTQTERTQLERVIIRAGGQAPPYQTAAERNGKLADFGRKKVGGARKDTYQFVDKNFAEEDFVALPLSKIFPKPEIDKMENKFHAAFTTVARDEIPNKPRTKYKVKRWAESVDRFYKLVQIALAGDISTDDFIKRMEDASGLENVTDRVKLLMAVERDQWSRIGKTSNWTKAYKYVDGKQVASPSIIVSIDGARERFEGVEKIEDVFEQVNSKLAAEVAPENTGKPMAFEVRGRLKKFFIMKKGDREYRHLKEFDNSREALLFAKENNAELVKLWDEVKARDNVTKSDMRRKTNLPRSGQDYRNGKHVTSQMFEKAFAFKWVEFGNWVKDGKGAQDRQGMLDQAYDALMDLANIAGIPSQAISLGGELSLGLGARGKSKAMAHFESGLFVINLTKTKGAGSLAHEWFHALDNYFQRKRSEDGQTGGIRAHSFITYDPNQKYVRIAGRGRAISQKLSKEQLAEMDAKTKGSDYYDIKNWELDPNHKKGVRPEVESEFAKLVKALDESPMKQRAATIDAGKENGYWSRVIERAARSFESYVIATMQKNGYHNDFLANVVTIEEFSRNPERYPYLLEEEIAPVAEAFDGLFRSLKSKEAENGMMLYSKQALPDTDSQNFKKWSGGAEIIDADDINSHKFVTGKPVILKAYHATTHEFDVFDASINGNVEGQFGAVNYFTSSETDAEVNYMADGEDLTGRITRRAERLVYELQEDPARFGYTESDVDSTDDAADIAEKIARDELAGDAEKVMEVYIKTSNPFVVDANNRQWHNFVDTDGVRDEAVEQIADENSIDYDALDDDGKQEFSDEYENEIDDRYYELAGEKENDLYEAVQQVAWEYGADPNAIFENITESEVDSVELEKALRESADNAYIENDNGDLIGSHVLAQIIKNLGFDSIILKDADRRFANMNMGGDVAHIHIFDENASNIKSVENSGEFSATDPNIYKSKGLAGGLNIERARQVINSDERLNKLHITGKLVVVEDASDIPTDADMFSVNDVVQGAYLNGVAYVVANGNRIGDIKSTAWHEVTHAAMDQAGDSFIDAKSKARIFANLQKQIDNNDGSDASLQSALDRVAEAGARGDAILEEVAAYLVTDNVNNVKQSKSIIDLVKSLIASIKAAIIKYTGLTIGNIDGKVMKKVAEAYADHHTDPTGGNVVGLASKSGYKGKDNAEAAEWLAAKAKGLDMSKAARMERAYEMGFDTETKLYHGTSDDISKFDLNLTQNRDGGFIGEGVYLTSVPRFADFYANNAQKRERASDGEYSEPNVIPVFTSATNTKQYNLADKNDFAQEWQKDNRFPQELTDKLKGEGYDSAEVIDASGAIIERVIFDPKNIRSINAAFDPDNAKSPNLLASVVQNFNTFFSGMGRALSEKMPNAMPAKALANQLQDEKVRGKWGIKAEEVEWTGIVEWLQEQDGKVTKQEIADFIEANQVQVEEVELSNPDIEAQIHAEREAIRVKVRSLDDKLTKKYDTESWGHSATLPEIKEMRSYNEQLTAIDRKIAAGGYVNQNATKYKDYTVKGEAENYRELLLTLPNKNEPKFEKSKVELKRSTRSTTQGDTIIMYDGAVMAEYTDNPELDNGQYKQKPESHWLEVAEELFYNGDSINEIESKAGGYQSSHWNEKNILAHVRFDERTDADGNKVLFINEIQSDWHQEGRKKGYKSPDSKKLRTSDDIAKELDARLIELGLEKREAVNSKDETVVRLMAELDSGIATRVVAEYKEAVPNAPFKGNAWVMLAMKRMIRHASENGFDKVAWATGEQSADLYSLEKQVDAVNVRRNGAGEYVVTIEKEGEDIAGGRKFDSEEGLSGFIGKDLANKIVSDNLEVGGKFKTYSGLDLKVGGEGMRGFYDKTLPNLVQKYIKKWGGKVDGVNLSAKTVPEGKTLQGEGLERAKRNGIVTVQHGFTITDDMRSSAMRGQPLFSKEQTLGNNGNFDGASDNILFSRRQIKGNNKVWRKAKGFENLSDATYEATDKMGRPKNMPYKTLVKERIAEHKDRFVTKLRQGMLDQFDSIRTILGDRRSWMMSQMTAGGGAVEAAIEVGRPYRDASGAIAVDAEAKDLAQIFEPLGNEVDRFLMWLAGNRAEGLKVSGKENLFSDADIASLKALNYNNSENAEGKGVRWDQREATYEAVRAEFEEMHNAIVQIGVDTGIVSQEDADIWKAQGFYVPFYRIAEEDGTRQGVMSVSGLVGQEAYKKLKGADMQLDDLLLNTLMNWEHIVSAGLKNQAAKGALATAESMGLAQRTPQAIKSKKAIYVREDGKEQWYNISDTTDGKLVLDALTALNYEGLTGAGMKVLRKFKRALTYGVTASPEFKLANLIRDTLQAIAVADMSTNFVKNVHQGWKATADHSNTIGQMIAGGGAFGNSGYIHGADPEAIKIAFKKGIDRNHILGSNNALKTLWDKYQDFGARLENVNRAANFEQSIAKGDDLLTANFNARDHLDFQRTGGFVAMRFLTQAIPFLNARMQGLDKMARAFKDPNQRQQITAVIGVYAIASSLMYLYMKDDDDYQQAEEWERDTYHLIKLPNSDVMYRIPRPFEVGAIANVVERVTEQLADDEVQGKVFAERLRHMLTETFSVSLIPQAVAPALEVRANKSNFTQRQIESMSMQRMSAVNRIKPWTSQTAIGLSKALNTALPEDKVLSPIQIDYLMNGYFGWVGTTVTDMIDMIARPMVGAPTKPAKEIQDYPVVGRFARENPRNSKFVTQLYENREKISRIYADMQSYKANKELDKYKATFEKNKEMLRHRKAYNKSALQLSRWAAEIKRITNNKKLGAEAKRDRINRINLKRLELSERTVKAHRL